MIFLFFVLLTVLSGCSADNVIIYSKDTDISINVEIVDTNAERARGLMFRESLCGNCGMLFAFDDLDYRSFWMKNTLMPLDIIFIDARYVLEVNGGFTKENNINVGDKLVLR